MVQGKKDRLELNEEHKILVCADGDNLLADNISIKRNTKALLDSSRGFDLGVDAVATGSQYNTVMSCHRAAAQNFMHG
jgi:hypothetical protein